MASTARHVCMTRDMAHVNVAAIVATCIPSLQQQQQQQQPASPSTTMLLYAIDSTDCHNLKLFLQRCRGNDVSIARNRDRFIDFKRSKLTVKLICRSIC